MAQLLVAANSHTVVDTGWTNPSNAYATSENGSDATLDTAKNTSRSGDFGFPDVTSAQIPDGSTINSVVLRAKGCALSAAVTGGVVGNQPRLNGANNGTEQTNSTTTDAALDVTMSGVTLADLRSASTLIFSRMRATKGNSNTGSTARVDAIYLDIDYTASGGTNYDETGRVVSVTSTVSITDSQGMVEAGVSGSGYVILPGASTDHVTTPDAANLDITGDIEIIAYVHLDSITSATRNLVSKGNTGQSTGSWILRTVSTGALQFVWRTSGGVELNMGPGASLAAGGQWVRFALDVDNGASQREGRFWTSDDPPDTAVGSVTWDTRGTHPVTQAGATDINAGTAEVSLGNRSDDPAEALDGRVYCAFIYDAGSLVADPDFRTGDQTDDGGATFDDNFGHTWTVEGNADWFSVLAGGPEVDVVFTVSSTDALNAGGTNFDETGRQVSVAFGVTSTDSRGMTETGAVAASFTVASTDSRAMTETGAVAASFTVESTDTVAAAETTSVTATFTVTSTDAAADTEAVAVVATTTVSSTDVAAFVDDTEVSAVFGVSSTDSLSSAPSEHVTVTAVFTVSSLEDQHFDEFLGITAAFTVTSEDSLTGAPDNFQELGRLVAIDFQTDISDVLAASDGVAFTITTQVASTDSQGHTEAVSVPVVFTVSSTDQPSLPDAFDETGREVAFATTVGSTDVAAMIDEGQVLIPFLIGSTDVWVRPVVAGGGWTTARASQPRGHTRTVGSRTHGDIRMSGAGQAKVKPVVSPAKVKE